MKENSKYKYLFKNIGLLTIGSFSTKLLSFFLVPLYTGILTTAEYGKYDLIGATVGVVLPILTLNIQDAVLRYSLDKNMNRDAIVTISAKYLLLSNLIVAIGILFYQVLGFGSSEIEYLILFFIMFFTQSLSGIMTCYIRGIDRVKDLTISSIIASAVTIVCNVLFLVAFQWGLVGYCIAGIIGPLVQSVYLIIRSEYIKNLKFKKYTVEEKEMVGYSKPLIANSIAWWVNNASDRYVILFFRGLSENGIYAVAGKIPTILNIFQAIFNQAWTLSVVKEYDREDQNGFFSKTYEVYNCMMVVVCSGIILLSKIVSKILYAKEFYEAWKYVPWLTMSVLFGALAGYIGGFFTAVKDSKAFAISTIIGAIVNVTLNLLFIPICGAMGAAIATAICYFVTWAVRYNRSKKYIKLRINVIRDMLSYILMVLQSILLIRLNGLFMFFSISFIFAVICVLYRSEMTLLVRKVLKR